MEGLKPPQPLSFDGNLSENWKRFKQKYEIYAKAAGLNNKEAEVQVNVFLHVIGDEALEKFNTFDMTDSDKEDVSKIIMEFEKFCIPKSNESVDRHIFFARNQEVGESFDDFLTSLKKLSSNCGFGDLRDSLIRDRIISGVRDKILKDRLLRENDLTLEKCIKIAKANELAESQMKTLQDDKKIDALQKNKNVKPNKANTKNEDIAGYMYRNSRSCGRCGKFHKKFSCPAFNKVCKRCHKKNHFQNMCKSKSINSIKNRENDIYTSVNNDADVGHNHDDDEFVIGTMKKETASIDYNRPLDWVEKLKVNISKYLFVKLDTGAQCNVIPLQKFQQLKLKEGTLKSSNTNLTNYNGSEIKVVGKCNLFCETSKGVKSNIEFQVVESESETPVLGLPSLIQLNLVKRIASVENKQINYPEILNKFKDVFSGLGKIKDYTYDIKLKPDAVGKIEPCRKVPVYLMKRLKSELNRMDNEHVIKRVNEPTEFVNSLVIVPKKDGTLRLCLDPQYLNNQILREHFHLPTFEEIISRMKDAKYFSILDANKAFWQIQLSEESCKLTTFNSPFGRFCFLRLPYGICSAPEVFHRCFSEIFGYIEGVEVYIDDILVWGSTQEEHDIRLNEVLRKAREKNIKFNLNKCKINVSEVKYLGHIFSEDGLKPDPDKVDAILKMETPNDKKELERFLGMITYVSKFIPKVSQLTTPLRELLKKCNAWNWSEKHDNSFRELKNALISKPVLQYFDVDKPVTLSVDASQNGLGAVLLQNHLPVAYASKALNDTQINYAQIEKETLAIVFGCEKFHQFLFGQEFTVESDHKPLETIFKKPLSKCPARLQRMRIRLQPYTFNLIYKPGRELLLADALSRSFCQNSQDFFDDEIQAHVAMIVESLPMSEQKMKVFQEETKKDDELQEVLKYIKYGWPEKNSQISDLAKPYRFFKEELSYANGLVLKNSCVVVPRSLRKDMIKRIHFSHMGIEKSKNKAREIIFWPGMSKDIEDAVSNCMTCISFQKANSKQPMILKEIPQGPWEVLGTDLFHMHGRDYILIIDYFSKYVEVAHLPEINSGYTIKQLKASFARFGIPKVVYSDNGPQYSSLKFKQFAKTWNFQHRTSSPHFPQSNGMVERHIQTIKSLLKKAEYEGKDPFLVLLDYRNTPISNKIPSPIELLIGRKTSGIMPIKEDFFPNQKYDEIRRELLERQLSQKGYYDKGTKNLEPLADGDNVVFKLKEKEPLEKAKILSKANRPRSYRILAENGNVYERNRRDLRKSSNKYSFQANEKSAISFNTNEDSTKILERNQSAPGSSPDAANKSAPVKMSRSGRIIRTPAYLRDYV